MKSSHNPKEILDLISHEISSPLTVIQGLTEILLEENISSKIFEKIKKIQNAAHKISAIVDNFAYLEKKEVFKELSVDLYQVIAQYIDSISYPVKIDNKTSSSIIFGNEALILIAIKNLVENAYLHAETNKEIIITIEKKDQKLHCSVQDQGKGIEKNQLEKIFQPYYQVKSKGKGLGLYLVKMIMEKHYGSVLVESLLGQGSLFTLIFPN